MMRSLGETQGLLLKAATGAGLHMGQAEDCTAAGLWLILHDIDGASAVLEGLSASLTEATMAANIDNAPMQVARDGAALLDLALATVQANIPCPNGLDAPLLMMGLAGIIAARDRCRFHFSFADGGTADVTRQGLTLKRVLERGIGCDITFSQDDAGNTELLPIPARAYVPDRVWGSLTDLAARTYVPASDQSRHSGAGAGLSDND